MLCRSVIITLSALHKTRGKSASILSRSFRQNAVLCADDGKIKEVAIRMNFENIKQKNRNTYIEMVKLFIENDVYRRGHVEFIYSALKHMKSFGVEKDLDVYKSLIDVLPKGKFIPTNIFQAEFMHYPKQQQCAIDLLEQMEDNGVMPDAETEDMLLNVFGKRGFPLRKFWRMMYWMPKFKNLSPWPVPNPPPDDALELAKLAIARISSADIQAKQSIFQTSDITDAIDETWIVSSQSPIQKKLLAEHTITEPIYVEGAFRVWLRTQCVNYFMLRANVKLLQDNALDEDPDDVSNIHIPFLHSHVKTRQVAKVPSVHEQEDGIIYALCATGTSSKDSLLSWIRHLEKENSVLLECPIVFTLRTAEKEVSSIETDTETLDVK